MAKKYLIRHGEEAVSLELREGESGWEARREGDPNWRPVHLDRAGDSGLYLLLVDSHPVEIYLERRRGGAVATIGRHAFDFDVGPWRPLPRVEARARAPASGEVRVTAPMTGSIVEVRCQSGDVVTEGQVLLLIESMKMNNELRSPAAGTVSAVPVTAGQRVAAGALLVTVRPEGTA